MRTAMAAAAALLAAGGEARNNMSRVPPMGWMSWEIFRCETNCASHPDSCINEELYRGQADAMVSQGFLAAGYTGIHMDDCWERKSPSRDATTGRLVGEPTRFGSGMKALGDYYHKKGAKFGLYTAESSSTCGGYPGSKNNEQLDAKTFAEWGVDYMKVDGCGSASYYPEGYKAMGAALEASGREIEYSCSWPAYIGSDETKKPFQTFIDDGCNGWRNYADIQCNWGSLGGIIDHWGQYGSVLKPYAGPGHWHDMDMLIIGNGCVTEDEERTQMAIWAVSASPMIMGNDMRSVPAASKAILLNKAAIAISQDPLGEMGIRLTGDVSLQVWARNLTGGDVAVALYNKGGSPVQPPIPGPPCTAWNHTTGGYYEACGGASGNVGTFSGLSVAQAQDACCKNSKCAGFSYSSGSGYYKGNAMCGVTKASGYDGYTKPNQILPSGGNAQDITLQLADVGMHGSAHVTDVWTGASGTFTTSYTAKAVPYHGTAFLRLSRA